MTQSETRIAILGVGLMGAGMARRLLRAGFSLAVYNRTAEKARALVADGARLADSPRGAATGAQFIISMVADDASGTASRSRPRARRAARSNGRTRQAGGSKTCRRSPRRFAKRADVGGCDVLHYPLIGRRGIDD